MPPEPMPPASLSLRTRLTVGAAALLCLALIAGALALTTVLTSSRVAAMDDLATSRAIAIHELVASDRLPASLPVAEAGEIAQVLDAEGAVLASSLNASRTLPVLPAGQVGALRSRAVETGEVARAGSLETSYDAVARVAVAAAEHRGSAVTIVATMPAGEVSALMGALRVALTGVVPTLTLLFALAIWLVLGRALAPVERLRLDAAEKARSGASGPLPEPARADEIGALARTLNEMLTRIDAGAARQRAFVSDAAHELRSPVATMLAVVEVARAHPDPHLDADVLADLHAEAARMSALIEDLLALAKVGATRAPRAEVDLLDVARRAAEASQASGGERVRIEIAGSGLAWGSADPLVRVVRNLIENAVRHAHEAVAVVVAPGVVAVDDDGEGIAPDERERVFERFVRLDQAREREAGGAGLGLAIARETARELGGDVTLADSPAGGLRARLTVPVVL